MLYFSTEYVCICIFFFLIYFPKNLVFFWCEIALRKDTPVYSTALMRNRVRLTTTRFSAVMQERIEVIFRGWRMLGVMVIMITRYRVAGLWAVWAVGSRCSHLRDRIPSATGCMCIFGLPLGEEHWLMICQNRVLREVLTLRRRN